MSDFLNKVQKATFNLGTAPYDDEATRKYSAEITKRTIAHYEKLKNSENKKEP